MQQIQKSELPAIGTALAGGVYAGLFRNGDQLQALIVSPKAEGQIEDAEWGNYGNKIEGREAIAKAFEGVWTTMPDVQWADHSHFVSEDGTRGVSQWTFRATNPDGTRTEVQGADLFRFRHGRIVEKQAIRKQRPNIPVK